MPRSEQGTALVGVRFSRGSIDRGGQAPALRARKGFFSPCAVREQALPNYGHWGTRAIAGDRPPRYGIILLIVLIVIILLLIVVILQILLLSC